MYRVGVLHSHPLIAWAVDRALASVPDLHVSVLDTEGRDREPAPAAAPPAFDVLVTDHVPSAGRPLAARIVLMSATPPGAPGTDEYLPDRSSPADLVRAVYGAALKVRPSVGAVPSLGDGGGLSPREEQVLDFIAAGLTHAQAARRLGISQHTVDTHVKRIRAKLGVGNKAEMVRLALARETSRPMVTVGGSR
ncbi:helix-turn-helix transcriptional regulator [Streptomyces europaeiscabiei]|uniref:helix-turn-helix transcriptional regulator n=1 Tax=Streptomyces europaeiscabiei TaxID=146819 RepID=UPI002E1381C9|nr:LuxR C-terminal-related transcriptional regulator [Streptomyces europaeiscabiei]